jgi:hypothetical protein
VVVVDDFDTMMNDVVDDYYLDWGILLDDDFDYAMNDDGDYNVNVTNYENHYKPKNK